MAVGQPVKDVAKGLLPRRADYDRGGNGIARHLGQVLAQQVDRAAGTATFVVDAHGHQSEQIDIVIHDRHFSPLWFKVGGKEYIPAERVYAVFEAKQTMSKDELEYAGKKIASVRSLHRTSVVVPHAGGKYDPVVPRRVIGGFLARRSAWKPPFGDPFEKCLGSLDDLDDKVEHGIDIGCAIEHGGFSVTRDKDDLHTLGIEVSEPNVAIIFFVMRLLGLLQTVGSAPAIDNDAYLRSVPGP